MAREIRAKERESVVLKDEVEEIYERRVTPYGNGAKVDSQKRHIGKRAYVLILKD